MLVQEFFPNDERFKATHAIVWAFYKTCELNVEMETPPQLSNATIALHTRLSPRTVSEVRNELASWGYELKPFIIMPTLAPPATPLAPPATPLAPPATPLAPPATPVEKLVREKKKGTSWANSGFFLDEVAVAYYLQKIPGGNPTEEFERFVAYHESKGTCFVLWQAAWRNWVLNSKTFATGRKTNGATPSGTYQGIEI